MRDVRKGRHVDLRSPRGYYLDYSDLADPKGPTDGSGLPLSRSQGARESRSPSDVARFALGNLELYLESGRRERRDLFETAVRWMIDNIEVVPDSFGGWAMPRPPRGYRDLVEPGWFSAAAQGECVSALVRAGALLGLPEAMDAARTALGAFGTPVADGGLLREIGDSGQEGGLESLAFLEQYPAEDQPTMVLSGHVRALWGVYDYARSLEDRDASALFDRCARGLTFVLDRYDVGYWARSNLDERWRGVSLAGEAILREQALEMHIMYEMTGDGAFEGAARRWEGYLSDRRRRSRAFCTRFAFWVANGGRAPA